MTHVLQQLNIEVIVSIFSLVRPTEACLEREGVGDAYFLPHDYSGCSFLCFLHLERAVRKIEHVQVLVDQFRKDLLLHSIVDSPRVAIHKNVFLA